MKDGVQTLLILDFGSQYTQLIGRRAREMGVFSIIVPFRISATEVKQYKPLGIILSGGPNSVYEPDSPQADPAIFDLGIPILGICYGLQLMTKILGGVVETSPAREYGKASLELLAESTLFEERHNTSAI